MRRRNRVAECIIIRLTCSASSSVSPSVQPAALSNLAAGGQRQQEKRGPSMLTQIEVELADMYMGKHVEVSSLAISANALTPDLVHGTETNSVRPLSRIRRHDRWRYQAVRYLRRKRRDRTACPGLPGHVHECPSTVRPALRSDDRG